MNVYPSSFQFSVQVNIDGHTLDYLLTVDQFGQVYEASPLIFELPIVSRKLILGETDGQLERKIRAHAGLFKYLVPLVLANQLPAYQESLAPLVAEIDRRLQEQGLRWATLTPSLESESQANQVLMVYGENSGGSSTIEACWEKIIVLIEKQKSWPIDEVRFLGAQHAKIAADFFPGITPFYPIDSQHMFYENLNHSQSEGIKNYLLEELREPSCLPYANGIIYALEKYASEDPIYQAVINFYNLLENKENYLNTILSLLKHYPLPRTKEICLEVIDLNEPYTTPRAVEILLSMGMPQEEIVKLQLPHFKSGNPDVSHASFTSFAEHISAEHLPGAAEVLDIYVQELIHNDKSYAVIEIPAIAIKTKMHWIRNRLYDLLAHENPQVRFGILAIINGYFEKNNYHFQRFLDPEMVDRYWDLANDSEWSVASRAIRLLGRVGIMTNRADYIDHLLEIGSNTEELKYETIIAINLILRRVPYQPKIEPFYLAFLEEEQNAAYHALRGLRYSPNRAFKRTLWEKFKDHPVDIVRKTADQLFKPTYRRWMGIRIGILKYLQKISDGW